MVGIVNFIKGSGTLVSPPILTEFREIYPNQNGGILGPDALRFAQLFNNDVVMIEDNNYIVRQHSILIYIHNGAHMFYIYNNGGMIEKWDPASWQHTSNNCTLYSALLAIIRPISSFEETKQLIKKIVDAQNSEGARLLGQISLHFFSRGQTYFRYFSLLRPIAIPPIPQMIKSEVQQVMQETSPPFTVVFIHGMLSGSYFDCVNTFKHLRNCCDNLKLPYVTYYRDYTVSEGKKKETFDLETDFTRFCSRIPDTKLVLVGHSYGGLVANAFNTLLGERCIQSISLDGCEFWFIWYTLVQKYLSKEFPQIVFDESKCKFDENSITYDGKKLDISKIEREQFYQITYKHSYTVKSNHIMVQYKFNTPDSEYNSTYATFVQVYNSHYTSPMYELYYGTERNHHLHNEEKISKDIFNTSAY